MAVASDLIFGVAMAAVAVNAASAVLETEDKHMDLVGATIVGLAASLGGGSLRDVLVNEVPLVMRPGTLYATASWCGALAMIAALAVGAGEAISAAVGGVLVLGLRLAAIRYRLKMPEFRSPP